VDERGSKTTKLLLLDSLLQESLDCISVWNPFAEVLERLFFSRASGLHAQQDGALPPATPDGRPPLHHGLGRG